MQRINASGASVSSLTEFARALVVNKNDAIGGLSSLPGFLPIGWLNHATISDCNSISPREPYARRPHASSSHGQNGKCVLTPRILSPLDGSLRISLHEAGDVHAVIPVRHAALEHGRGFPSRFALGNQAARATIRNRR
jgi:hypothetical protein